MYSRKQGCLVTSIAIFVGYKERYSRVTLSRWRTLRVNGLAALSVTHHTRDTGEIKLNALCCRQDVV